MRSRRALTSVLAACAALVLCALPATANDLGGIPEGTTVSNAINDDPIITPMDGGGCTWAAGPAGSRICINVQNPTSAGGTTVDKITGVYHAASTNICETTFQFKYETRTASPVQYRNQTSNGCAPLQRSQVWDPNPNIVLQHGSQACVRAKNALTGNAWTPWACATILA